MKKKFKLASPQKCDSKCSQANILGCLKKKTSKHAWLLPKNPQRQRGRKKNEDNEDIFSIRLFVCLSLSNIQSSVRVATRLVSLPASWLPATASSLGRKNLSERLSTSQTLPWAHITWQGWNTHSHMIFLQRSFCSNKLGLLVKIQRPALCPALYQHTDGTRSKYKANRTAGFTWHPPNP